MPANLENSAVATGLEKVSFHFNPKERQHSSKVMLKILQGRLQHYVNRGLPDIQAAFRKGKGTFANIRSIIENTREFKKNVYFCLLITSKPQMCRLQQTVENSKRDENTRPPDLSPEKSVCRSRNNG